MTYIHTLIILALFTGCSMTPVKSKHQKRFLAYKSSVDIRQYYNAENPLRTSGVNSRPGCGHIFIPLSKSDVEAALTLAHHLPDSERVKIPNLHESVELVQSIRDLAEEAYEQNGGKGPVDTAVKQKAYAILFKYLMKKQDIIRYDIVSWDDPKVFQTPYNQRKVLKLMNFDIEGTYIRFASEHTGELFQAIKVINSNRHITHLDPKFKDVGFAEYHDLPKSEQEEFDYEDAIQYYAYNIFGKKHGGSYVYSDEALCKSSLFPNPSTFLK